MVSGHKFTKLEKKRIAKESKRVICRGFIRGQALSKSTCCKDDLATWFDHLEESFSYKEVRLIMFCLPVKTSCPLAENVNETSVYACHLLVK